MKKLFAVLTSLCLLLSGCQQASSEPSCKDILLLFGRDKADVLDSLPLHDDLNTETEHDEERITIHSDKNGSKETTLIFYNNVLMGVRYLFDDTQTAFAYAKEIRPEIDEVFGEKTTYPGIISSSSAYFDDISDATELQPVISYYEDWTPQTDETQISKMLDGREAERVDARLTFTVYPENGTEIKIRYSAIIKRG